MLIFYGTHKKGLWYVTDSLPPNKQTYMVIHAETRLQAEVKLFSYIK